MSLIDIVRLGQIEEWGGGAPRDTYKDTTMGLQRYGGRGGGTVGGSVHPQANRLGVAQS